MIEALAKMQQEEWETEHPQIIRKPWMGILICERLGSRSRRKWARIPSNSTLAQKSLASLLLICGIVKFVNQKGNWRNYDSIREIFQEKAIGQKDIV